MATAWTASLSVSPADQAEFVAISGDANPLHTDELTARRLPFGRVAIHGVHLALLALDLLATIDRRRPHRVRCTFRHPVAPGDRLDVRVVRTSANDYELTITHDVWRVAILEVLLGDDAPSRSDEVDVAAPANDRSPSSPERATLGAAVGEVTVQADMARLRARVPDLVATLGARTTAELVTVTRLVGMHVPGRHSLLSSFDLTVRDRQHLDKLEYRTNRFDERFSKLTLDLAGARLVGSVVAFVRPSPVEPAIGTTRPPVNAFTGQRWLVVGGSRGLGAIAAMLLAAGGADVRITYRIGSDDADHVAAQIGATTHELDVTAPDHDLRKIIESGWRPTHLAYFASPAIFDGERGAYSSPLERRFRSIYIDGLDAVIDGLDITSLSGLLWPSSVAVDGDVPGLAEYTTVKKQGEVHLAELGRRFPHLRIETPRFPRLATDQTASFLPIDVDDAPTTVLQALQAFSA